MSINDYNENQTNDYRGKRAAIYLRVSSEEQKKKYGLQAQLSSIRDKIVSSYGLILDEEKHIIRDAYTGMTFRERPELTRILEMAERQEFDVLIMDTLDRLGRKGLQRELYRAELRSHNVRILTTEPSEHADDDSLMGEMIRLLHGFKAEQERNDIVRRTVNGRRERVKEGKLLPGRKPLYGYQWGDPEIKGKSYYILHPEESKVVERMFLMAKEGFSTRGIARILTEEGIPTPEGKRGWHSSTVERLLKHPFYTGKAAGFRWTVEHRTNYGAMVLRPEEEQIHITNANPVPAIVTSEIFQEVQEYFARKKQNASRNNSNPEASLLRCGLIKCGYCGCTMSAASVLREDKVRRNYYYRCFSDASSNGIKKCIGGTVSTEKADQVAWATALKIIRNPQLVDQKIADLRTPDPTARRRQQIIKDLADAKRRRGNIQNNLNDEMEKDDMDAETVATTRRRIRELSEQIKGYEEELKDEEITHKKWSALQEKLNELHKFCACMSEKIDDPTYTPSYQKKRDALEFFGISVTVLGFKKELKMEVSVNPPSIVSLSL